MRDSGGPAGAGALVLAALEFRHMLHEPCMCHVKNELETYGGLLYGALALCSPRRSLVVEVFSMRETLHVVVTAPCVHNVDHSAPPSLLSTADGLRKGARNVFAFAVGSMQHRPYRNKCFSLALLVLLVPRSSAMATTAPFDGDGTGPHRAELAPSLPHPLSPLMAPPLLCTVQPCTEANDNEAPGSYSMRLVPSHRRELQICTETCNFASDGLCDDGGPGAEYLFCSRGSDCTDCGFRVLKPPSPPPYLPYPPPPPYPPAPPPPSPSPPPLTPSPPMSTGASAVEASGSMGIIIGVLVGVVIVLVLALDFMRRRCNRIVVHPLPPVKDEIPIPQVRHFNVFISHCTNDDSHRVFEVVSAFLRGKGKTVFNPTTHLTHAQRINSAAMADAVKRSGLVVAALSHGFFNSAWCQAEIKAAKEAGIKVVPTFSGDNHGSNQIDQWVREYRNHATFGYVFRENARDVLNKQNDGQVTRTLDYLSAQC